MVIKSNKITVVGAGQVGATTAYTLLLSGLASELVLIDLNKEKAYGEVLDLAHGIPLCPPADIISGDYADAKDSDIVIITAGANMRPGETRMDLLRKNVKVFESIVPQIVQHAPNALLLVVTNPVDVLTYVTQKVSGLPKNRVIGSGTVLDTSRLRYLLSRYSGVDARNVHTYVLGEHGDTELPVWSLTNIAGMGLDEYCALHDKCEGKLSEIVREQFASQVRDVAYTIIESKGATFYAVALAVRRIVESILRNEQSILTISSLIEGPYGLKDVCLSLPTVVGAAGVHNILPVHLNEEELTQLYRSADSIKSAILEIGY